jgi:hypothetical protein
MQLLDTFAALTVVFTRASSFAVSELQLQCNALGSVSLKLQQPLKHLSALACATCPKLKNYFFCVHKRVEK